MPIKDLVHSQKSKVITELLLQLHSYPKRVMTGFSFIIKNDERSKWEGSKISKPELAKYIQPQFLGVLNFFDTNLKNETGLVTLEEKVDILSSLTEIIKLMGSEFVASVKHKILSTLNSGLSIQDIREDVLINSWESFITTIDVSALNPILGQVIACLLHLPGDRKAILKLCLNLLVDKKESLKNSFSQLNFVPEDWQQLAKIIREENGIGPTTEFKLILKLVTNSLSNENNDVKILTLEKILSLLKLNQEKLQGLVLSNEETDPFITFLIMQLLECSRSTESKVASLAGT